MSESPKHSLYSASILHPPNQPFGQKVGVSPTYLRKRNSLLPFSNVDLSHITKYRVNIRKTPHEI